MKQLLVLVLTGAGLVLVGCWVKGIDDHVHRFDSWIASSKDDRVREMGIPLRCHQFKAGGEMCEWPYRIGPETIDTVNLTFDGKSSVCSWSYRGFYGERRSQATC